MVAAMAAPAAELPPDTSPLTSIRAVISTRSVWASLRVCRWEEDLKVPSIVATHTQCFGAAARQASLTSTQMVSLSPERSQRMAVFKWGGDLQRVVDNTR